MALICGDEKLHHSVTATSWKSSLCSSTCSPQWTGPSLRIFMLPLLLRLELRRATPTAAGLISCEEGYDFDTAGARERKVLGMGSIWRKPWSLSADILAGVLWYVVLDGNGWVSRTGGVNVCSGESD